MKKSILFLLLVLGLVLSGKSQVETIINENFESASGSYNTYLNAVSPAPSNRADRTTAVFHSNSYSMKLMPADFNKNNLNQQDTVFMQFSVDIKQNKHAYIEFYHICLLKGTDFSYTGSESIHKSRYLGGVIQVKPEGSNTWQNMSYRNALTGYPSTLSSNNAYFQKGANPKWSGNQPANSMWVLERLSLSEFLPEGSNISKCEIRFVLIPLVSKTAETVGWFIDDFKVEAGLEGLEAPEIKMVKYPVPLHFPENNAAQFSADITIKSGLKGLDSAYLQYKKDGGSIERVTLNKAKKNANNNREWHVEGEIPFSGYDVLTEWQLFVTDSTLNSNKNAAPSLDSVLRYKHTRSTPFNDSLRYNGNEQQLKESLITSTSHKGGKWQAVYDKALLDSSGIKAGTIESIWVKVLSGGGQTIPFSVKMVNVDSDFKNTSTTFYVSDRLTEVFNRDLTLKNEEWVEIYFNEPFKYTGDGDLLIQFCTGNLISVSSIISLKVFEDHPSKRSISTSLNKDNVCSEKTGYTGTKRPDLRFSISPNSAFAFDAGITGITSPVNGGGDIQNVSVQIHNFGTNPITKVKVGFKVDGKDTVYKDIEFTIPLVSGETREIPIKNNQPFSPGYRNICVWTDSLIDLNKIDYEDRNNFTCKDFVACPTASVPLVIGEGGNFLNFKEAESFLKNCIISAPITFLVKAGDYVERLDFSGIVGTSSLNTITFKPESDNQNIRLYFDHVAKNESKLISFTNNSYFIFKNMTFEVNASDNSNANLIELTNNVSNLHFDSCRFISSGIINSFVSFGGVNSGNRITNCTFEGAKNAINLKSNGTNNRISYNQFNNQSLNALFVDNQTKVVIDSNQFFSQSEYINFDQAVVVLSNSSDSCYFIKNTVYSENGAMCLYANKFNGVPSRASFIANNMFSSIGKKVNSTVSISNAENLQFVYNSMYVESTDKLNSTYTANIAVGNSVRLDNVQIKNNIFINEKIGYALRLNVAAINNLKIDYNSYYTADSNTFLRYGTKVATNLLKWTDLTKQDTHSIERINPRFFAKDDLRTFSEDLRSKGTPIAGITKDMFNENRSTLPCLGAFEYPQLDVNLGIELALEPVGGCRLSNEQIKVRIKNRGRNPISSVTLAYQINNGGSIENETQSVSLNSNDFIDFVFSGIIDLSIPSGRFQDSIFSIKVWNVNADLDKGNDTLEYKVVSNYYLPARTDTTIQAEYETSALLNVPSDHTLFWFGGPNWTNLIPYVGNSYQTPILYNHTTYYVAQKYRVPKLKFTEVQLGFPIDNSFPNREGFTNPYPDWLKQSGDGGFVAVEITNVGNYSVNLADYEFVVKGISGISNTNKRLPDMIIEPGKPLVFQLINNGDITESPDSSKTFYLSLFSKSIKINEKFLFTLVKNGNDTVDCIPFNGIDLTNQAFHVPDSLWADRNQTVVLGGSYAGIRRISYAPDASAWKISTNEDPLTLGEIEDYQMLISPNECYGDLSQVHVHVNNIPNYDLVVTDVTTNIPEGVSCNLDHHDLMVHFTNNGNKPWTGSLKIGYQINDRPVVETSTITTYSIAQGDQKMYTFSNVDFTTHDADSVYIIKGYVKMLSTSSSPMDGDFEPNNDTLTLNDRPIFAKRTPNTPQIVDKDITISHGSTEILKVSNLLTNRDSIQWFDRDTNFLSMDRQYKAGPFYKADTFFANYVSYKNDTAVIADSTILMQQNYYPQPFTYVNKAKQQFIIEADELKKLGYRAGPISKVQFYISEVVPNSSKDRIAYQTYNIYMQHTRQKNYTGNKSGNGDFIILNEGDKYLDKTNLVILKTDERKWFTLSFDKPFYWDGTHNIVMQINSIADANYHNGNTIAYGVKSFFAELPLKDYKSVAATYDKFDKPQFFDEATQFTIKNGQNKTRPNMKFVFNYPGCTSEYGRKTIAVNPSSDDVSPVQLVSPLPSGNKASDPVSLTVKILNRGSNTANNIPVYYEIDGRNDNNYSGSGTLPTLNSAMNDNINLFSFPANTFSYGKHSFKVWTNLTTPLDLFRGNDTLVQEVRFCYPEASIVMVDPNPLSLDFHTPQDALNHIAEAGMCGSVTIKLKEGVYTSHIIIPEIDGLTGPHTLTIQADDGADPSLVIIKYSPTITSNYVVNITNKENIIIKDLTIKPTGLTYANGILIDQSNNIQVSGIRIILEPNARPSANANGIVIYRSTENLQIIGNQIQNTNIGISMDTNTTYLPVTHMNTLIKDNAISDFDIKAVNLCNVIDLNVEKNLIKTSSNKSCSGIYVKGSKGGFIIQKNEIIIKSKIKDNNTHQYGIYLDYCKQKQGETEALLANNMISLKGMEEGNPSSYAIFLDNFTQSINVFHNTVRVQVPELNTNTSSANSSCLTIDNQSKRISIKNNNFVNVQNGYVYKMILNSVEESSNNNLFTTGSYLAAYNGRNIPSQGDGLGNLQNALGSGKELDSGTELFEFLADTNLRQKYPDLREKGVNLTAMVDNDIDYSLRSGSPSIGAHEYLLKARDFSLREVKSPIGITQREIFESQKMRIIVKLENLSSTDKDTLIWTVRNLSGTIDETRKIKLISAVSPFETRYDTLDIFIPVGKTGLDTLIIYSDMVGDENHVNDTMKYLYINIFKAFDLEIHSLKSPINTGDICSLDNAVVSFDLRNKGRLDLIQSSGNERQVFAYYQLDDDISTRVEQNITDSLPISKYGFRTIAFDVPLNIPGVEGLESKRKLKVWIDLKLENNVKRTDSLDNPSNIKINIKPVKPVSVKTDPIQVEYGSRPIISITHPSLFPVSWYNNKGDLLYGPGTYAASTQYTIPNPIKGNILLNVVATNPNPPGCKSDTLKIHIEPLGRINQDIGVTVVSRPLDNLVYNSTDSVSVTITNFGLQEASNFKVYYRVKSRASGSVWSDVVEENFTSSIAIDTSAPYTFQTVAQFNAKDTFEIESWTGLSGDVCQTNDTTKRILVPKPFSKYCEGKNIIGAYDSLRIVNVSLGLLNNQSPPVGNKYKDFTIGADSLNAIELYKGYVDTLTILCQKPSNPPSEADKVKGWVKAFIDWNRNGEFEPSEQVFSSSVKAGTPVSLPVAIPESAFNGFMKMRVIATTDYIDDNGALNITSCNPLKGGEVQDYLLFVRPSFQTNAALASVVSPGSLVSDDYAKVVVQLKNLGENVLTDATIRWQFNEDASQSGSILWNGSLNSNATIPITLGTNIFTPGVAAFKAWVEVPGDENSNDDTIYFVFNTPAQDVVTYINNFEKNGYSFSMPSDGKGTFQNLWTIGTPNSTIAMPYEGQNVLFIDDAKLKKDQGGNRSYLYTPVFITEVTKPDTLRFVMMNRLGEYARMYVEYLDKDGNWELLGQYNDGFGTNWYNHKSHAFIGNKLSNEGYKSVVYKIGSSVGEKIGKLFQLRFVYVCSSQATEGTLLIDDFAIAKAVSNLDVGVYTINNAGGLINPGMPIQPRVTIKNYGSRSVDSVLVRYQTYGMMIPKEYMWSAAKLNRPALQHNDTAIIRFPESITVEPNFPGTFELKVWTDLPGDAFRGNDTATRAYILDTLAYDVELQTIVSPLNRNLAGEMTDITVRIRNNGKRSIYSIPIWCMVGDTLFDYDSIIFMDKIGTGLTASKTYDYTFSKKIKMFVGVSSIKVYSRYPDDSYVSNDTIEMMFRGVSSITDIRANKIILDTTDPDFIGVQLNVQNVGGSGVNSFTVGYYIDGDISTLVTETLWRERAIAVNAKTDHLFMTKIPKQSGVIPQITAFVQVDKDENIANDTTKTQEIGYTDGSPFEVLIEDDALKQKCKVRVTVKNSGNLIAHTFKVELEEKSTRIITTEEIERWLMPGTTTDVDIDDLLTKTEDNKYNILVRVTVPGDNNPDNDETTDYIVSKHIPTGIDEIDSTNFFTVEQNYPNPFTGQTQFHYFIPNADIVKIQIISSLGKVMQTEETFCSEGTHIYTINSKGFSKGMYIYMVEYKGERIFKKMIVR